MSAPAPDRPNVRIIPPLVYLTGLVAGLLASVWWPSHVAPRAVAWTLGGIVALSGAALSIAAARLFRRRGTTVRPDRASSALVIDGPFRLTRNPMYVGLALFYLGIALGAQSLCAIILLPLVLLIIRYGAIAHEEAFLERRFGKEYADYKRRVRRWL